MAHLTRRRLLAAVPAAFLVAGCRQARAEQDAVAVPSASVGAILAALAGDSIAISVDAELGPTSIQFAGQQIDIGGRLLLKGSGDARRRFLDDARNAARLAANLRDLLGEASPELRSRLEAGHKAWARPFAKRVFGWTKQLADSPLAAKRVVDAYGRIYLLEWAGAVVEPSGQPLPSGLDARVAALPSGPSSPTAAAYEDYVEQLVGAILGS